MEIAAFPGRKLVEFLCPLGSLPGGKRGPGRVDSGPLPAGGGVKAVSPEGVGATAESLEAAAQRQIIHPAGQALRSSSVADFPPSFVAPERRGAGAVLAPQSGRETGAPLRCPGPHPPSTVAGPKLPSPVGAG